jgi:hypothetical protein
METMTRLSLNSSHARTSGHFFKSFSQIMRCNRLVS